MRRVPRPIVLASMLLMAGLVLACRFLPDAMKTDVMKKDDPSVQAFLDSYSEGMVGLHYGSAKAAWRAATDVSDEHTEASIAADKALSRFTGDAATIGDAQSFLKARGWLSDLQV